MRRLARAVTTGRRQPPDFGLLEQTSLELQAKLFVKPWRSWDALGDGAYRQGSVRVTLVQRI